VLKIKHWNINSLYKKQAKKLMQCPGLFARRLLLNIFIHSLDLKLKILTLFYHHPLLYIMKKQLAAGWNGSRWFRLQCVSSCEWSKIWQQKFTGTKDLPKNAIDALQKCNISIFLSTFKLLQILATLSVTTSSSEWSFSTLKRLKTYLWNTTCENRLNSLAMMNIHSDIDPDDVLNKLTTKTRRLRLTTVVKCKL